MYGVLNKQLADNEFVAGSEYSIADMAIYPWIVSHKWQSQNLEDFPHVQRWFNHIKDRPATVKAYALVQKINPPKA
ncbi:Disulfide-bond oxidoreductase YghU [compost metagenome]